MDVFFGKKKTSKELRNEGKKDIRKAKRSLDREREHLKRQEQQIQAEIKAALKRGDEVTARILAKQVIANRNQQQKLLKMSGTMTGMQYRTTTMGATETMQKAMATSARVMNKMNEQLNVPQMTKTLQEFQKQSQKMDLTEEMLDDTMEDLMGGEDVDADVEQAMDEVLDEIGIDLGNKLGAIKTGSSKIKVEQKESDEIEDDLLKKLAELKEK